MKDREKLTTRTRVQKTSVRSGVVMPRDPVNAIDMITSMDRMTLRLAARRRTYDCCFCRNARSGDVLLPEVRGGYLPCTAENARVRRARTGSADRFSVFRDGPSVSRRGLGQPFHAYMKSLMRCILSASDCNSPRSTRCSNSVMRSHAGVATPTSRPRRAT